MSSRSERLLTRGIIRACVLNGSTANCKEVERLKV
jgi:hypothetical protein